MATILRTVFATHLLATAMQIFLTFPTYGHTADAATLNKDGMFRCSDGKYISLNKVCDMENDCEKAEDENQNCCTRDLFNPANSSPFFENGSLNVSFIDNHEIGINPQFWSPYYLSNLGYDCNMDLWKSPYNTGNYTCYQIITHHYIKENGSRDVYTPEIKKFRDTYHSFFDMVWTPDKDDTYLVLTCIHRHSSHCDVLIHIAAIENDTIPPVLIATRQIGQSHTIRTLELSDIILKKNQKYILTIEIRAIDYYDIVRHRRKHYWFSILRINQSCAKTKNPNEEETILTSFANITTTEKSNDGRSITPEIPVHH